MDGVGAHNGNLRCYSDVPIGKKHEVISCKLTSIKVRGDTTDIAVQYFGGTPFIVVTQFQKIGSLFHIIPDSPVPGESSSHHVKVLMGESKPEMIAFCDILAHKMPCSFGSMILSLALKADTFNDTTAISEIIRSILPSLS